MWLRLSKFHASLKTINDFFESRSFSFFTIKKKYVSIEINKLNSLIAILDTDIPVKIFKESV